MPRASIVLRCEAELERREKFPDQVAVTADAGFMPYGEWLAKYRPEFRWDYPHMKLMQGRLDNITLGKFDRQVFAIAIRHGKTQHNTVGYIAYRIHQDPTCPIILAMYKEDIALTFSREIRALCRSLGVQMSIERDAAGEWETTSGGGLLAQGRSGLASRNAKLIVIDDMVGERAEAESPATRESTWFWFSNDVMARVEPGTAVIVNGSRWHMDDALARIKDRYGDRWDWLTLQGVAEYAPTDKWLDELGREEGELLWPELRPQSWMDDERVALQSYGFESLMQLNPTAREGGMFKWDWFGLLGEVPKRGRMVRYWDTAGTDPTPGGDPDYTAGVLACRMDDGRDCIVDVVRFRLSPAKRDVMMEQTAAADLKAYGARVTTWIERETGVGGKDRTNAVMLRLHNVGMKTYSEPVSGSKRDRADPVASKAQAGNLMLCPGKWRESYRLEMCAFTGTGGGHDDQTDATSGAVSKLNVKRGMVRTMRVRI